MTDVLQPLAARYAHWLNLPDVSTADTVFTTEGPAEIRAMPVILHIERSPLPGRTALLAAAAAAAVAVCLDPRAEPGGPWHPEVAAWTSQHIRKVARRARGAHWQAAEELPGITVTVGDAQARALLPGLVTEVPKEVSRLQISGSELPADEPGPAPADRPVLWLTPHVPMTAGKAAAQVGHGTMLLAALLAGQGRHDELAQWFAEDCRCAVRQADERRWAELAPGADPLRAWQEHRVVAVRDAGFTEVAPGTVTVLAQWPAR